MKKNAVNSANYDPIQRLNEVDSKVQVPSGIELQIRRNLQRDSVKKGEVLLEMNTVCDRIWFIQSGLFRSHKKVKGREENTWFMKENDLMTDPKNAEEVRQAEWVNARMVRAAFLLRVCAYSRSTC